MRMKTREGEFSIHFILRFWILYKSKLNFQKVLETNFEIRFSDLIEKYLPYFIIKRGQERFYFVSKIYFFVLCLKYISYFLEIELVKTIEGECQSIVG